MECFIGVDVGTASVRSALFQKDGKLLMKAVQSIDIHNPSVDYYEQSTDNIWAAVVATIKVGWWLLFVHHVATVFNKVQCNPYISFWVV